MHRFLNSILTAQNGDDLRALWASVARVLDAELLSIEGEPLTLRSLVMAVIFLVVGLWLSRRASNVISRRLHASPRVHAGAAASLASISYYILTAFFVFSALRMANVPLTVFTVIGGALAIGVGFGSQNIINNFVSGLILLLERPIKIGDFIEIDGTIGTVTKIGARSTQLHTPANMHLIVPNSFFLEKEVLNWTLADNIVRTELTVGVAYGSPTRDVERILLEETNAHPRVLTDPKPYGFFEEFGDSALVFRVLFWVNLEKISDRRIVAGEIRHSLAEAFERAGITIAFPQVDAHLESSRPLEVRILQDGEQG